MTDNRISEIIRHLHPSGGFQPWHGGPTVSGALRGVSVHVALWKPDQDRHNIWELALHIAYWNYAVCRRLTNGPKGSFERKPSDWPRFPVDPSQKSWESDRRFVKKHHDLLIQAISEFDGSRLEAIAGGKGATSYADLITGALLHDTYHVGQIQLMKRLASADNAG
jgi:uncharacterized damage-inducible protein DinB